MVQALLLILCVISVCWGGSLTHNKSQEGTISILSDTVALATSKSGFFEDLHFPNNSIVEINLEFISNIHGLQIISQGSEIHFNFEMDQLTLKPNKNENLLEFRDKTFKFGGFSKMMFKGKCNKWILDFSNVDSQVNHTIMLGKYREDEHMISIESQSGLFEDVFLARTSELLLRGGDANETFALYHYLIAGNVCLIQDHR